MRLWCILIFLISFAAVVFGQDYPRIDSTAIHADTVKADTSKKSSESAGIDTVVSYSSADSVVFFYKTKVMSMYRKGDIKYQKMGLQAERIDVDWNTSTMSAFGVPDSSDTSKSKLRGAPVMIDGGEQYQGKKLRYDFKSKKGTITIADTKIDQGYYHGEDIKKMAPDVLFIEDGRYTTCDDPDPHYYFSSPKMKVMPGDKVVAEPIYFYIEDVPVFWLPLGVFPARGGRHSGLLAPAITEDATHGRMLHHLGYYWAISDYMDASVRTDLYTKGSWALYSDFRYALRYYLNGGISGNYIKLLQGEPSDPDRSVSESYYLNLTHSQTIDPTLRLNANFTFASNNAYQNTIDLNQALQQDITSNATLSKVWEGTNNSAGLSVSRRQDLIHGNLYETLPSVQFNHSQSYPFRSDKSTDISDLAWYEMIGVSYSGTATNTRNRINQTVDSIKTTSGGTNATQSVHEYEFDHTQSLGQTISANIAPKLGHFTISPNITYTDNRSFTSNDVPGRNIQDSSLTIRNDRQSTRLGTISSGISASTNLYGMWQPGLLGIAAFRHTLTPSLSFTYSKQILGDNLGPKQMVASLSLHNVFEAKMNQTEKDKEPTKLTLLNFDANVGYDFAADSMNFTPISTSYHTAIGSLLVIGGAASFDPYKLDEPLPGVYNRVNTLQLPRLTNFSVNMSTAISGPQNQTRKKESFGDTLAPHSQTNAYAGYSADEEPDFSIPWKLALSWDYSENRVPGQQFRSSAIDGSLEFNLTENWKISTKSGYDVVNKEFEMPDINISRDLHCWIMNFEWVPTGAYRHYSLEIRLKAPQLKDIKVTKQGSDRGIY